MVYHSMLSSRWGGSVALEQKVSLGQLCQVSHFPVLTQDFPVGALFQASHFLTGNPEHN